MIELHEMEQLIEAIEQELGRSLCPLVRQAFLQVPRHLFIEQYYQQRGSSLTWDLPPASTVALGSESGRGGSAPYV